MLPFFQTHIWIWLHVREDICIYLCSESFSAFVRSVSGDRMDEDGLVMAIRMIVSYNLCYTFICLVQIGLIIHKWAIWTDNHLEQWLLFVEGIACGSSFMCFSSWWFCLWPKVTVSKGKCTFYIASMSCIHLCPLLSLLSRSPVLSFSGIQPPMMTQGEQRREAGKGGGLSDIGLTH